MLQVHSHDSNPKSHVTQDDIVSPVQNISSILEQDVSDMEVTNLSTDVVHPYKNPSTRSEVSEYAIVASGSGD
jgi:hypothetical protein